MSDRSGNADIVRQRVDEASAEPLVTGPDDELIPRVSPDGQWVLYVAAKKWPRFGSHEPVRIMRVALSGGPSQEVLTSTGYSNHECATAPADFCVLGEQTPDRKRLMLVGFDPLKGRGRDLAAFDLNPLLSYSWALSPNGRFIALLKSSPNEGSIRFFSLSGSESPSLLQESAREVPVKGWGDLTSADWSTSSNALFISGISPGGAVLLRV